MILCPHKMVQVQKDRGLKQVEEWVDVPIQAESPAKEEAVVKVEASAEEEEAEEQVKMYNNEAEEITN
ncbi:hypothetical protein GMMP15_1930006 [Candidatus Magnetomoraceae bacterium gMMP-15]